MITMRRPAERGAGARPRFERGQRGQVALNSLQGPPCLRFRCPRYLCEERGHKGYTGDMFKYHLRLSPLSPFRDTDHMKSGDSFCCFLSVA